MKQVNSLAIILILKMKILDGMVIVTAAFIAKTLPYLFAPTVAKTITLTVIKVVNFGRKQRGDNK
jgi:hypothetical protein